MCNSVCRTVPRTIYKISIYWANNSCAPSFPFHWKEDDWQTARHNNHNIRTAEWIHCAVLYTSKMMSIRGCHFPHNLNQKLPTNDIYHRCRWNILCQSIIWQLINVSFVKLTENASRICLAVCWSASIICMACGHIVSIIIFCSN